MRLSGRRLPRSFYLRPTLDVAQDLIRKTIVYHHPEGVVAGDIVEVEAYIGEDDPACHAAVGLTERNRVMYGNGGFCYIYFIYGMYHCLNVVTERRQFPAAVLIRAVEPVAGREIMVANSPAACRKLTDGPGKLCRAFGLTRRQNGLDLTGSILYLIDRGHGAPSIGMSQRIGVRRGADRRWRFFDQDSDYILRR